jgi:hypothetical protein
MSTLMDRHSAGLIANLAALAMAAQVHAQTKVLYVDDDAPLGGNGTSWSAAYRHLQSAFSEAATLSSPDAPREVEIRIAQGVYRPDEGTLDKNKYFELPDGVASGLTLSVLGAFGGLGSATPDHRDLTSFVSVLSGDLLGNDTADQATWADNSQRILYGDSQASLTLDGLVISGSRRWPALDIAVTHATPYLHDVVISRCTIENNIGESTAFSLYGLGGSWSVPVRVEDCTIRDNRNNDLSSGNTGSGMNVIGGNVRVARTLFENNRTLVNGGAVCARFSWIEFADCIFTANSAALDGSALYLLTHNYPAATVERCTFFANPTASSVVAISCGKLHSSIIHDAGVSVPGLFTVGLISGNGNVSFEHCDIEGGQASISDPQNRRIWGAGNIDANPQFGPDLQLLAGSPCIDAGRLIFPRREDRDFAGLARIIDGDGNGAERVDMGAHEFQVDCPADFDGSGFVDTDDFDAFVRAFEAGC